MTVKHQREFVEGFRITREPDVLIIEATDYHARPLRLSQADLSELGIRLIGKPRAGKAGRATEDREKPSDDLAT
jgi:hypothetical protein